MTAAGMILGTAAYMAPEQARGKAVDKRADIWAFGVVLYEMLTGTRLFDGESVAETLGLIFAREPDLTKLPPATPARVRDAHRALPREGPAQAPARHRRRAAADRRRAGGTGRAAARDGATDEVVRRRPVDAGWLGAADDCGGRRGRGLVRPGRPRRRRTCVLSIAMPPGEQVTTFPAITSDGQVIAYVSGRTAVDVAVVSADAR